MVKNPKRLLVLPFLMILFASCNNQVVMEESHKIDTKGWHAEKVLVFEHEIEDTTALHDVFLNVRNNNEYPYSNFYVFFQTQFPDGTVYRDTIEMLLADREGKWTGKGFGRIKSNSFHFRKDVWFPLEGTYEFSVQHAMREEYLEGIVDIGMRIERK